LIFPFPCSRQGGTLLILFLPLNFMLLTRMIEVLSTIRLGIIFTLIESVIGRRRERLVGSTSLSSSLLSLIPRVPIYPHYSHDVGQWVVPVPGMLDGFVVRRSAQLTYKGDSAAPV